MPNHKHVNQAIETYVVYLWFTDEVKHSIEISYGKDVLNTVTEIYLFAGHLLPDSDDDIIMFIDAIKKLGMEYPYLTDLAKIHIANIVVYFWK